MDELSQNKLQNILKKEPLALTDNDKSFLRARQSYLNSNQRKNYAEVLGEEVEPEEATPNLGRSRSYRALQGRARELGLPFIGVTREDLERSVDTAEGPGTSIRPS